MKLIGAITKDPLSICKAYDGELDREHEIPPIMIIISYPSREMQ